MKKFIFISFITVSLLAAFYFVGFQAFGQESTPTPTPTATPPPDKSLTLISPNGGEQWEVSKTYDITWKATGIDRVVADIYKEEKFFDSLVITSADIGKCSWTVYIKTISELPGEKYKIRVSDYGNSEIYDESDNYFSIVEPCTDSDGGKDYYVKGTSSDYATPTPVEDTCISNNELVEYSCTGKNIEGVTVLEKETYYCPFGCKDGVCIKKALTLTSPNGGEQFVKDQIHTIKWISSGIKTIAIDLYKGGSLYLSMAKAIENTGEWSWAPASGIPNGNDYKLRVLDSSDPSIYDESDNYFSIVSPTTTLSITVLSPNGGEVWQVGSIQKISWQTSNISSPNDKITIYIVPAEDLSKNINLAQEISNTGSYSYTVDDPSKFSHRSSLFQAGNQFKIFICAKLATSNNLCSNAIDWGDAAFSIVGLVPSPTATPVPTPTVTPSPSITVLSPNGGEVWAIGQIKRVSWSAANVNYVRIYIEDLTISGSGSTNYIYDGAISASTGYYDWTIKKNQLPGATLTFPRNYKIRIDGVNSPEIGAQVVIQERSDNSFTIQETTVPSITTLSPNSGSAGTNITVYGSGFNNSSLVLIGDNVASVNPSYVSSDGTKLSFTFPAEALSKFPANVYSVRVSNVGIVSVGSGLASNYLLFQILSTQPSLALISPNGGEQWKAGGTYNIQWKSTGIPSDAKMGLQLSYVELDGNHNRYEIAMFQGIILNTGSYSWKISDPLGDVLPLSKLKPDQFLMRVIYAPAGTVELEDYSDSTFSIISATSIPTPVPTSTPTPMPTTPMPTPILTKGCGDQCIAKGYAVGACTNASSCDMYGGPDLGETFDCKSCPLGFISGTKDCVPPGEKVRCCCEKVRPTPIPSPSPTSTPIPQPTGYFRNAYWQCYDGTESNEGGPTSCKPSQTWQKYADEFCYGHCYADNSKCGVNSFKVWNECPSGIVCNVMVDCASGFFPVKTGEKDQNGCPIIKCEKEKPVPTTPPSTAGCQTDDDCQTGGCNNELCFKKGFEVSSICLWKPEYECMKKIGCKCQEGKCQWQQTSDFRECLSKITEAEENRLIKVPGKPDIYVIKNGKLHHVPSWNAFVAGGYKMEEVKQVEEEEIVKRAIVNLIRIPDDPKVYVVGKGLIRHIPSPEVFNSYNFSWGDIVTVSPTELKEYGQANLIRGIGEAKVYLVENGQKRWIKTAEIFKKLGYDWGKIVEINATELKVYSAGSDVQ